MPRDELTTDYFSRYFRMMHRLSRRLRARSHITLCNTRARFIPQSDPNLADRERERERQREAASPLVPDAGLISSK